MLRWHLPTARIKKISIKMSDPDFGTRNRVNSLGFGAFLITIQSTGVRWKMVEQFAAPVLRTDPFATCQICVGQQCFWFGPQLWVKHPIDVPDT